MNQKEQFINFLRGKSPEKSGKPSAYAKAMEVIEDVLFAPSFAESTSIWEFVNISNIDGLYNYVIEQQNADKSVFETYEPQSYWKKGFCSAALKEYKLFLQNQDQIYDYSSKNKPSDNTTFNILEFEKALTKSNLITSSLIPYRFLSALLTKPFVILTGLAGSGKTKLAEALSLWLSEDESQYCMVSVGADWTNRDPLLGYPNALEQGEYVQPDTGVLDLLLKAVQKENQDRPYFLILDEMNMSHVERYFADFLSAMETVDRIIALHPDTDIWKNCPVPATVKLPPNLFIIGTVNIDETTYMFSPKVLDRASVIEFRVSEEHMSNFFKNPNDLDFNSLRSGGASMGANFVTMAKAPKQIPDDLNQYLMPFFKKLQEAGAEFGYRTAVEISRFIAVYENLPAGNHEIGGDHSGSPINRNAIVDAAIMQKLLPKVHGSRNKIEKILKDLARVCLVDNPKEPFASDPGDIKYPLSYDKLQRMYKRVVNDGFTSYAEA